MNLKQIIFVNIIATAMLGLLCSGCLPKIEKPSFSPEYLVYQIKNDRSDSLRVEYTRYLRTDSIPVLASVDTVTVKARQMLVIHRDTTAKSYSSFTKIVIRQANGDILLPNYSIYYTNADFNNLIYWKNELSDDKKTHFYTLRLY